MQTSTLATRKCQNCGQEFPKGSRKDKVFCGDSCRNNYNKEKRATGKLPTHKNRSEILKIIKRNYEFLRRYAPIITPDIDNTFCEIENLKDLKDFNPKFYTSTKLILTEQWYFCFDLGFRIMGTYIEFVNSPEQAEL